MIYLLHVEARLLTVLISFTLSVYHQDFHSKNHTMNNEEYQPKLWQFYDLEARQLLRLVTLCVTSILQKVKKNPM